MHYFLHFGIHAKTLLPLHRCTNTPASGGGGFALPPRSCRLCPLHPAGGTAPRPPSPPPQAQSSGFAIGRGFLYLPPALHAASAAVLLLHDPHIVAITDARELERQRKCADTTGTVPVPRDWPFPTLKYEYIFQIKIYGNNFLTKLHSETVTI